MTLQDAIELFVQVSVVGILVFWGCMIVVLATCWVDMVRDRLLGYGSWGLLAAALPLLIAIAGLWAGTALAFIADWQAGTP